MLQSPQSGTVTVTGSTPGAVARYICDRGFELIGESERTCQNGGSYNGQAPICQCEYYNVFQFKKQPFCRSSNISVFCRVGKFCWSWHTNQKFNLIYANLLENIFLWI